MASSTSTEASRTSTETKPGNDSWQVRISERLSLMTSRLKVMDLLQVIREHILYRTHSIECVKVVDLKSQNVDYLRELL